MNSRNSLLQICVACLCMLTTPAIFAHPITNDTTNIRSQIITENGKTVAFDSIFLREANKYAHQYMFTSSAFMQEKNTFSVDNYYLGYFRLNYAVTDYITVSSGITPFNFTFNGPTYASFRIKAQAPIRSIFLHAGASVNYVHAFGSEDDVVEDDLAYAVGLITLGTPDVHGTIGFGAGYIESTPTFLPLLTIAEQIRLGKRFYVSNENVYAFGVNYYAIQLTGRTTYNHLAIDYGFWTSNAVPLYQLGFYVLPSIGFTVQF